MWLFHNICHKNKHFFTVNVWELSGNLPINLGTHTCAGRPGSLGYEIIDAFTYALWGVDYLKYPLILNEHFIVPMDMTPFPNNNSQ